MINHRGKVLHRLCARALIKQLEEKEQPDEKAITDLAIKYSLGSRFTSFVAVEDRKEATSDGMEVSSNSHQSRFFQSHGCFPTESHRSNLGTKEREKDERDS